MLWAFLRLFHLIDDMLCISTSFITAKNYKVKMQEIVYFLCLLTKVLVKSSSIVWFSKFKFYRKSGVPVISILASWKITWIIFCVLEALGIFATCHFHILRICTFSRPCQLFCLLVEQLQSCAGLNFGQLKAYLMMLDKDRLL